MKDAGFLRLSEEYWERSVQTEKPLGLQLTV